MAFVVKRQLAKVKKVGTKSTFYIFNEVDAYGKDCVDVREHFERADGSMQHTGKGLVIPFAAFLDLMGSFRDVAEELREVLS